MSTLPRLTAATALAVGLALLTPPAEARPTGDEKTKTAKNQAKPDILKTAAAAGKFKTLLSLLIAAGLDDALKADGPFTVFAPTDDAFAKLPKGTVEALLKPDGRDQLKAILTYHVVPNKNGFRYDDAEGGRDYEYKTLNGATVKLRRSEGGFRVSGANVVTQNVSCRNGSVQVIDAVLIPPTAARNTIPTVAEKAGMFKTLLAALTAADLADVLSGDGPFTVFAPTDEAFARLPKGTLDKLLQPDGKRDLARILKYHVVAGKLSAKELVSSGKARTLQNGTVAVEIVGGKVTINQATVVNSDVAADNGVVHVIDRVLTPGH